MKVEQPRIFGAHLTTAYWIQSNALFPPSDKEVEDVWHRIWRGRGVGSMRLLDDIDTPIPFPIHHTQPCLSSCNRVCICICTSSRHGYCPIPRPTANPRALLTATRTLFDCPYLCIVKGASPGTQGMCAFSPPIARLASRPWPVLTQTWHADEPRRIILLEWTCPISPS
ncbi:hypothetical protein HDV62DRAFT_298268 [Trichoderma sp. SZMC 28011]